MLQSIKKVVLATCLALACVLLGIVLIQSSLSSREWDPHQVAGMSDSPIRVIVLSKYYVSDANSTIMFLPAEFNSLEAPLPIYSEQPSEQWVLRAQLADGDKIIDGLYDVPEMFWARVEPGDILVCDQNCIKMGETG